MIRSQIQLIADNIHKYRIEQIGDNIEVEIPQDFDSDNRFLLKVKFCGKSWRTVVSRGGVHLSLTSPEKKFLEEVLRANLCGTMISCEELMEYFS